MKNYIIANLKMNKNSKEFEQYISEINSRIKNSKDEIIICPSNIFIKQINLSKFKFSIGIQDIDHRNEGASTGSIAATQIKDICKYAIVGHSERRDVFKEDNLMIKQKLIRCWENDITPILCIGEPINIRKIGIDEIVKFLYSQIDEVLSQNSNFEKLIIAYEPIWAIGTGISASINEVTEISDLLSKKLIEISSLKNIPILYGGSVNESNFKDFIKIKNLSGFLIGSASLDYEVLSNIVNDF